MDVGVPTVAGATATVIFALSTLPMVVKAARTKDLRSYSLSNILLSNMGNVIYSMYVFNLPVGPIWALHSFYLATTALMLFWYLRYAVHRGGRQHRGYSELPMTAGRAELVIAPDAVDVDALIASRP